jgi:hypothetical protein
VIKRTILILVWAVAFLLASGALLLVAWRIYFAITGAPEREPSRQTFICFGASVIVVPLVLGGVGAVIGMRGVLPGTQKERK